MATLWLLRVHVGSVYFPCPHRILALISIVALGAPFWDFGTVGALLLVVLFGTFALRFKNCRFGVRPLPGDLGRLVKKLPQRLRIRTPHCFCESLKVAMNTAFSDLEWPRMFQSVMDKFAVLSRPRCFRAVSGNAKVA